MRRGGERFESESRKVASSPLSGFNQNFWVLPPEWKISRLDMPSGFECPSVEKFQQYLLLLGQFTIQLCLLFEALSTTTKFAFTISSFSVLCVIRRGRRDS